MKPSNRLSRVNSDSILQNIFLLANDLIKSGQEIIQLSVGDPDEETPQFIKNALNNAVDDNKTHYISPTGSNELKKLISDNYSSFNPDKHEILTTMGSRMMLTAILLSYINEGDEVLIPAPFYPSFIELTEFAGGKPVIIDTQIRDFYLTYDLIDEKIREHKNIKFLILNSPNNPTGVNYKLEDLKKIVSICKKKGVIIISDECYRHFSENKEFSLLDIDDDAIIVDSFSKRSAMTGWRLGWCVASKAITVNIKKTIGKLFSSPNSFVDHAGQAAIQNNGIYDYGEERAIVKEWLDKNKLPYVNSNEGFYLFINVSKYFENKKITNSYDLAMHLLNDAKVSVAPGLAFGNYPDYIRLAFCLRKEKLQKALSRLNKSLNELIK